MEKFVELEHISKAYNNQQVLRDVSLTIDQKQVIAILGGNGTGKSTILRLIAGLEKPTSGKIIYPNKKIRIGYVPERFPKDIRFTPSEYLCYIGTITGISKACIRKNIPEFLRRFQLEKLDNHRINELSKGNIQKVGIIQAIMQRPELLILDEPISGLDAQAQQELLLVIKELKERGSTILLTYHESNIFEDIVETTYYIYNGLLSKTKMKNEKDSLKLIEVKRLDDSQVKQWEEVLHMKEMDNGLLLYVHANYSDKILSRILALQGSINQVTTVDNDGEWERE